MPSLHQVFALGLGAFASVLGSPTTPGTSPPSHGTQVLDANKKVTLDWKYDGNSNKYTLKLTAAFPSDSPPGWLALGFSSNGFMANGTYIMGYMGGGNAACVRGLVNSAAKGSIPVAAGAPTLSDTEVTVVGTTMSIVATTDLAGAKIATAGTQKVLFAASSSQATVPPACDSPLSFGMHHDLGAKGYVGSADVSFGPQLSHRKDEPILAPQAQCKKASYAFCCLVGTSCDCTKGRTAPGQCSGHKLGVTSYAFCCDIGTPCDCSQPPLDGNATAAIVV